MRSFVRAGVYFMSIYIQLIRNILRVIKLISKIKHACQTIGKIHIRGGICPEVNFKVKSCDKQTYLPIRRSLSNFLRGYCKDRNCEQL